ncbi:hypothetical protein EV130_108280 [Rhizobium azibense]|uniref:Uncharacterized protein n=1 Tax=Rhizobium azibense TaxID=1136135 RepID=A0A4R3RP64_9HYPH|nr:hypothetical protein EV130_108280 [Rhizobium azibense]TCU36714.1 hypothetical protein EV129_107282 [Rhizobium azibense]
MIQSVWPYRLLAFAVFASAYPLSFVLPQQMGWENGSFENLQVVAYAFGFVQAGILASRTSGAWRALWIALMPVWFILVARELSWAAVFHEPTHFSANGPMYQASKLLWYNGAVTPIVAALLLFSLITVIRGRVWRLLPAVQGNNQLPVLECGMTVVSVILMTAAEHHMGMSLDAVVGNGQIFEEAVELAASLFLLTAQQRVRMGGGLRPATLLSTPAWH